MNLYFHKLDTNWPPKLSSTLTRQLYMDATSKDPYSNGRAIRGKINLCLKTDKTVAARKRCEHSWARGWVMETWWQWNATQVVWHVMSNTYGVASASFLDVLLVRSPRKFIIFIVYKNVFWIKVSEKIFKLILKKEALGVACHCRQWWILQSRKHFFKYSCLSLHRSHRCPGKSFGISRGLV